MQKNEPYYNTKSVCNFNYLSNLMGGKTHLIKQIMATFLVQIKQELITINNAILISDYDTVKRLAHTMKSTVSIMGIALIRPVLVEMEDLALETTCSDSYRNKRLSILYGKLNQICQEAIVEIENYNFS